MTSNLPPLTPVILSGGAGSRLWPLSRQLYPKQLLPLVTDRTMIQDTLSRVTGESFAPPLIICNEEHRFIIAEQIRALGIEPAAIVLEPVGKNTAPAAAIAALLLSQADPDAHMLILPADHAIRDETAFTAAIDTARRAAATGQLTAFGIQPDAPETGYGYIEKGSAASPENVFKIAEFVEKPDAQTAQGYLDSGRYLWNSGMFLFPAAAYLDELTAQQPKIVDACNEALRKGHRDLDFFRLDAEAFDACPSDSIDYAVMEKTDKAVVVPADIGWTDVGAWSALWEIAERDADGNVLLGDVEIEATENCYIRSENDNLIAAIGVRDLVIVNTDDVLLVADRAQSQNVKAVVERLKKAGREEPISHKRVYRPWGFYQSVHDGERFQVKRITVYPGQKLSLQKHFHRAEHWVVVHGTGIVTRDNEEILLKENESVYIPLGAVHRLENPGKVPLDLIEVQSGSYLGEDDIVRLEDTYGRVS